jgi:hypothetical protein
MKDYYKVLGLPRNASSGQIKDSYRKLVKACHPDVNLSPKAWYGSNYLFGPRTSYSCIPDGMVFYESGDSVHGHEIELIPQVGGNLETQQLRPEDW